MWIRTVPAVELMPARPSVATSTSYLCSDLSHPEARRRCDAACALQEAGQVVFIANDWPTGLLPLRLRALQQRGERVRGSAGACGRDEGWAAGEPSASAPVASMAESADVAMVRPLPACYLGCCCTSGTSYAVPKQLLGRAGAVHSPL